jgi:hypothetical protein
MEEPPTPPVPGQEPGAESGAEAPSEEELRARIEEGLRKVRVQDVLLESVVTIINLTARRIGKDDERDLDQARVGIDAVRALVELLEPEPQAQVRNALSELQMLYARQAGEGEAPPGPSEGGERPPSEPAGEPGAERPKGEPPPGLWVPPGSG